MSLERSLFRSSLVVRVGVGVLKFGGSRTNTRIFTDILQFVLVDFVTFLSTYLAYSALLIFFSFRSNLIESRFRSDVLILLMLMDVREDRLMNGFS